MMGVQHGEPTNSNNNIFKPYLDMPIWQQRHLKQHNIKNILDIGCAEGTLINRLSRNQQIQLLIGIDMDEIPLKLAEGSVCPQMIQDQIAYIRHNPLYVKLYKMNVVETLPQEVLTTCNTKVLTTCNTRVQGKQQKHKQIQLVTLIEIIEHVPEDQIYKFCDVVFGQISPHHVLLTTPNQQFNVYFNFSHPKQMRHPDHKFQWNRQQFNQFCTQISHRYHYQFTIFGVGEHITEVQNGFCSQGASFIKKGHKLEESNLKLHKASTSQQPPILQYRYPFWTDNILKVIKNQILTLIIKNNYSTLPQIVTKFKSSKIGNKIMQENCKKVPKIYIDVNQQFLIDQINEIQYCYIDQEGYVYYEKQQSESEEDGEISYQQEEVEQEK